MGEWHFRKGFHLLIAAFLKAFPEPGEAELTIKTSRGADYSPPAPHLKMVCDSLDDDELVSLYARFDAYVTTSLAEGFGLPVAEAMAAKLPVLAPTWSGLADFCGPGRSFELPFEIVPQPFCSRPDYYAPGQQCCLVDVDATAGMLKNVINDSRERTNLAESAYAYVAKHFDPGIVGRRLAARLTR